MEKPGKEKETKGTIFGRLRVRHYVLTLLLVMSAVSSLVIPNLAVSASSPLEADCTLTIFSGNAEILAPEASAWSTGENGEVLSEGTTIRTGADTQAALTFFEGTIVVLDAGTELEIKELEHVKTTNSIVLMQWLGTTWHHVTKLIDPESRYQVETPSAYAMVRGTIFLVTVTDDGATTEQTIQGLVAVQGENQVVDVAPGQETTVEMGEAPSAPTQTPPIAFSTVKTDAKPANMADTTEDSKLPAGNDLDITLPNKIDVTLPVNNQETTLPIDSPKTSTPPNDPKITVSVSVEQVATPADNPSPTLSPTVTDITPSSVNDNNNPGVGPGGTGAPGQDKDKDKDKDKDNPGVGPGGNGAPGQDKDKHK